MKKEFSSGVIIYRVRNGRPEYLFLKRREGWLDGPKGHVEKGESKKDAAIREIREETGIDVKSRLDQFFFHSMHYEYKRGRERSQKWVYLFLARVEDNCKVTISSEHVGYEWLDLPKALSRLTFKNQKEAVKAAESYVKRSGEIERLNKRYAALPNATKDWMLSRKFVKGEGPADAKVMVVGQAPGQKEDDQGRPFIGISGRLLNELLNIAGLDRNSVYITSTVQFFPFKNRMPTKEEIGLCKPFLLEQIRIIDPEIIVLLGSVSSKTLLNVEKVMKEHGKKVRHEGRSYFITLHPAAAVRLKKNVPIIKGDFSKLKGFLADK